MESLCDKNLHKINLTNKRALENLLKLLMLAFLLKIMYVIYKQDYIAIFSNSLVLIGFYYFLTKKLEKEQDFSVLNKLYLTIISFIVFVPIVLSSIELYKSNHLNVIRYFYKYCLLALSIGSIRIHTDRVIMHTLTINFIVSFLIMVSFLLYSYTFIPEIGYDEIYIALFLFLNFIANMKNSYKYIKNFEEKLMKFDITLEKYTTIIDTLKSAIIMINISRLKIQINDSFLNFIKNLNINTKQMELFFSDENAINYLLEEYNELSTQKNFKNFVTEFELGGLNEKNHKKEKIAKFLTRLYYINLIFKYFKKKNGGDNDILQEGKQIPITFKNIYNAKFFDSTEKFKNIGNFHVNKLYCKERCIFELLFRKSKIKNEELLDVLINDNTEIYKMEEGIAENKLRKQYLSNVAHEFKAPIEVLLLTIKEMSKITKTQDMEKLEDIKNLSNYILILIMDIISFSKEENAIDIKFDYFEKDLPFDFAFKVLKIMLKNNNNKCFTITPELIIDNNLPSILMSDETRIRQLLINFISNANKFTVKGKITIRVDLIKTTELYDEIKVSVEDTGPGIPPENSVKLFKRFGKLEDVHKVNKQGTGLGLSICANLVDRIGNQIGYLPNGDTGSIFYFTFYNVKNEKICEKIENQKDLMTKDAIKSVEKEEKDNFNRDSIVLRDYCKSYIYIPETKYQSFQHSMNRFVEENGVLVKKSIHCFNDKILKRISNLLVEKNNDRPKNKSSSSKNINFQQNYLDKCVDDERKHKTTIGENIKIQNHISDTYKSQTLIPKEYNIHSKEKLNSFFDTDRDDDAFSSIQAKKDQNEKQFEFKKPDEKKMNCLSDTIHQNNHFFDDDILCDIPIEAYSYFNIQDLIEKDIYDSKKDQEHDVQYIKNTESTPKGEILHDKYDERLNIIYEIYKEASKLSKVTDFHALFQNFKNYLEFFLYNMKNIYEKNLTTICIVDDNSVVLKSLHKMILEISERKKCKFGVIKAFDGVEVLAMFKIDYYLKRSFRYILSDQNMSMMNGVEALTLIKKFSPDNPINLFICSSDDSNIKDQNLDFLRFLSKPVSKGELIKALNLNK